MIEAIFVLLIFMMYLALWSIKRIMLIKRENIDPQVMGKSNSNIQNYMNTFMKFLMIYIIVIIPCHALNFTFFGMFVRFDLIESLTFDLVGFFLGLIGLSFCLYAQVKMGKSWRVGIDAVQKTELVTTGLYALIRNPTYLGLFLVIISVWLIWPTFAMAIFGGAFFLFLEIQVRCEEDFLEKEFQERYLDYKKKTKRYFPFIY